MTARTMSTEQMLQAVVAMHRLVRGLRRASSSNTMPPTQLIVLALLKMHGPLRIGELANRIPCSQPTATTVAAAMQAEGLVARAPDPTDGRAIRVAATEQGLTILRSIALGEAQVLGQLVNSLGPDQLAAFLDATPVLEALADLSLG